MSKYWESKPTLIMMATVPHVTSGSGLIKFQADGFLLDRVYSACNKSCQSVLWFTPLLLTDSLDLCSSH